MIYELTGEQRMLAAPIFAGMDDTTILSCLQNYPGSHVWVDDIDAPTCAHALMGGVCEGAAGFSFLAGDASSPAARELVSVWPQENLGGCTLVPENDSWAAIIEEIFPESERHIRNATSKTEHEFDVDRLRTMAVDPADDLRLVRIDASMYDAIHEQLWSRDLVANFPDGDAYERMAVGFACVHDNEIVGAASCYSVYDKGIEIEIDTRKDFRRRGIARACASAIVLYALENGLYPSWDAANLMSMGLARSLGYIPAGEYPGYWLSAEKRAEMQSSERRD